jgi:hypothetical protein
MTEQPITFKAQLSPLQSAMLLGQDALQVKMIPIGMDRDLVAALYDLQECALIVTVKDPMGDISFNASFPDTQSAIRPNKKTPQIQIVIPKSDTLTGLRLYALFGVVFNVEIAKANGKRLAPSPEKPARREKKEREPKLSGPHGKLWEYLVPQGFFIQPCVAQVLEVLQEDDEQPEETLRRVFNVTTRADISPEQLIEWLKDVGPASALPTDNAILMIERGVAKTQGAQEQKA